MGDLVIHQGSSLACWRGDMGFFSGLSGLIRKSLESMTLNEALEGHLSSMRPGCGTVGYTDSGACGKFRKVCMYF